MTIVRALPEAAGCLSLADALALGPAVWDGVLARSGAAGPFLTWDWHRACADAVPPGEMASCRVVVLRSASGEVEALFPFRLQQDRAWGPPVRAVQWAFGDLGCPDHLDLLASPAADLDALAAALGEIAWTVIRLDNVADGAVSIERFRAACERRGWVARSRPLGRCRYLDLPASWDDYLASLTAHARHAIRRKERKLVREHHVALTEYGPERLEEGLRCLEHLHALRWDGAGAFRDPVAQRLHRGFAAALSEKGQVWLATLDVDGSPAAAWYGFVLGDTVYHYQSGRDPRWERERVGTVLIGFMIRRAIEGGYRRFDFLRGEESYKAEWTQTARPCHEVAVFRDGWRGAALRALDRFERPLRGKGLRAKFQNIPHRLAAAAGLAQEREKAIREERIDR